MKHAYFVSDNLDELEVVHDELVEEGLSDADIHVWSSQEAEVEKHHLRNVNPLAKTDILHAMFNGALVGAALAAVVLIIPSVFGLTTSIGFGPFVLAAFTVMGFSVWEAGLIGFHMANSRFKKISSQLEAGKHLLILAYQDAKAPSVIRMALAHPRMSPVSL